MMRVVDQGRRTVAAPCEVEYKEVITNEGESRPRAEARGLRVNHESGDGIRPSSGLY
jgi:hypothetical protein